MIERALTGLLLRALADTPVVLLVGGRQTGKSTLVTGLAERGHKASYVTLDDPTVLAAARADPGGFVDQFQEPAIIDEVQRAPEVFLPIKAAVDRDRRPGRFLLTGSANVLFEPTVADALAGRMDVSTLWPLSVAELGARPLSPSFLDWLFSARPELPDLDPLSRAELAPRIAAGGYPEAIERKGERRGRWFASYLATILERDVRGLADIERLEQLPALLTSIALRSRGPLNRSGLNQDLGIPNSSIERYLTLLDRVFLVKRLPAWHTSLQSRLVKSPKLLVADSGLLCHLLRLDADRLGSDPAAFGLALESYVGMELVKSAAVSAGEPRLMHYRTAKGIEIDFVVERADGQIAGVEVKAAQTVGAHDFKRFERLREVLGERFTRGVVLYGGDRVVPFGDRLAAWPISLL